jgi:hypothetical protein
MSGLILKLLEIQGIWKSIVDGILEYVNRAMLKKRTKSLNLDHFIETQQC